MKKPIVFDTKPVILELDPGTYYWCSCGKSGKQPFCDGGHTGTDFLPMPFELSDKKKVALCNCKNSKKPPFCDGAHTEL